MPAAPSFRSGRSCPRSYRLTAALALAVLAALLLGMAAPRGAWASVPERRRSYANRAANEYLALPAIASLPGIGVFAGVLGSASNIADTGINAAATIAKSIDNSDISVQALALQEVPTGVPHLSFDYQYANIRLGNLQVYLPGRDSPDFTIPITARFRYDLLRPTLRFWERRITASYTLAYFHGFDLSSTGNETPLRRNSASADVLLDLTDDVVDPHKGVRLEYTTTLPAPHHSIFGTDQGGQSSIANATDLRKRSYTFNFYVPFGPRWVLAWSNQYFATKGSVPQAQVVSGGSPPLRGFPEGRWSDRYGVFVGAEARYTYPLGRKLDILIAHGVLQAVQGAAFYELGQVSPKNDHTLFTQMHHSYGFGIRALFEAIVVRLDLAFSNEGPQTHLTVGYAF